MNWIFARRSTAVYSVLALLCLTVTAWQAVEHQRFAGASRQSLVDRGRDITSTLGVVVRSLRRFGVVIHKDRLVNALQELIHPGDLEHLSVLAANGDRVASAGREIGYSAEKLKERGADWQADSVTMLNLMDLGQSFQDERSGGATRPAAAIVLEDTRSARPGRPPWMNQQEYEALLQKQGVHSLVISLSTLQMQQRIHNDLKQRILVCSLSLLAVLAAVAAWRGLARYAELQIQLVKAVEANAHLKEMNLAAAGLAHETRNPLNLIRGHAQIIAKESGSGSQLGGQAGAIMEEADRVTAQLNEFINYSKPREVHSAAVELQRVSEEVIRTLSMDAEDKQVAIKAEANGLKFEADESLLRQALFNLVLNAVQCVERGGQVTISASQAGEGQGCIEVLDDGPGVPPEHRADIFKPYMTLRPKGVGLGLAIVQQIVAAHGWRIECLANEPRGARFRISGLRLTA